MEPKPLQLTMDAAPLAADRVATLDAYRAQAALGRGEGKRLDAAARAYLGHHPGMSLDQARPAVARILFEARRDLTGLFQRAPLFS
jgi:hypothetical protein